jgi:hypothetical protein
MICNNQVADGICDSSIINANNDSIKCVKFPKKTPRKHNILIYKQLGMEPHVKEGDNFSFISFKKTHDSPW